jgi:putative (di)nucleoside polyphosphate hydrolase
VLDTEGFRLNVAIILVNHQDKVLLAKRIKQNAWQLPQGGVNDNENLLDALYRELYEEIGLNDKDVSVIASTKHWLSYKLPVRMRRKGEPLFVGQKQKWFLLRFNGEDHQIRFDLSSKPEFDAWQWVNYWYPLHMVIDFKRQVYCRALRELSTYIYNNRKYNKLDHICR